VATRSIAVIGAGASGTLFTLHLLRQAPPDTRITLIERNPPFGPGLAYATANPNHLLNVPAGRMSAFANQPQHFLHWLRHQPGALLNGEAATEGSFVPRRLYGAYLRHLLHTAMLSAPLQLLHDRVVALDGPSLHLASGERVHADIVVLATGNDRPEPPREAAGLRWSRHWRADPWSPDAFNGLGPDASVVLIGTGLTMIDAVITLLDAGHTGPIHAVSRRGLLPRSHLATPADEPAPPLGLLDLTRTLRRRANAAGESWRGVIDALRPLTPEIWQNLSHTDRLRFLRHLRPWWDAHRHRMPPSIAARIETARVCGQLRVHAGRVAECAVRDGATDVRLQLRNGTALAVQAERVVSCTGPCTDVSRSQDPLLRSMLRDGLARPDECRLGLDVTVSGALVGSDGAVSQRLFALGPLTRGAFWEITAIPEIRRQTEDLALHIAHMLRDRTRERHSATHAFA
jgi:uncharacterized NAD(P)/FAD-binding protein YdhS